MSEPTHNNTIPPRKEEDDNDIDAPNIKDPKEKGEEHEYLFAPNASDDEINFCKSCSIESLEGSDPVFNANIQKEFIKELSKSYDPNNESDDELGTLIKMKRLTETYSTLFYKNVSPTPASQAIIEQCNMFLLKIKQRIREICVHIITENDIEVDINHFMHIVYCNRCETLFS